MAVLELTPFRLFAEIRHATDQGLVLGNDRFKAEMEALTGARLWPGRRGRPSKAKEKGDDRKSLL